MTGASWGRKRQLSGEHSGLGWAQHAPLWPPFPYLQRVRFAGLEVAQGSVTPRDKADSTCPGLCWSLRPSEKPRSWGSPGFRANARRRTPSCRQRPSAQPLLQSWPHMSPLGRFRATLLGVCVFPNMAPQGWEPQGPTPPLNQLSALCGQRESGSCSELEGAESACGPGASFLSWAGGGPER